MDVTHGVVLELMSCNKNIWTLKRIAKVELTYMSRYKIETSEMKSDILNTFDAAHYNHNHMEWIFFLFAKWQNILVKSLCRKQWS